MSSQNHQSCASDASPANRAPGHPSGLLDEARLLQQALRGALHDHLYLAALETRKAGESLVRIVVMGLMTAGLLLSAWMALTAAMVTVLVQRGLLTLGSALVLVFLVHCLIAMALMAAIRISSRRLLFPASISQLKQPEEEAS